MEEAARHSEGHHGWRVEHTGKGKRPREAAAVRGGGGRSAGRLEPNDGCWRSGKRKDSVSGAFWINAARLRLISTHQTRGTRGVLHITGVSALTCCGGDFKTVVLETGRLHFWRAGRACTDHLTLLTRVSADYHLFHSPSCLIGSHCTALTLLENR